MDLEPLANPTTEPKLKLMPTRPQVLTDWVQMANDKWNNHLHMWWTWSQLNTFFNWHYEDNKTWEKQTWGQQSLLHNLPTYMMDIQGTTTDTIAICHMLKDYGDMTDIAYEQAKTLRAAKTLRVETLRTGWDIENMLHNKPWTIAKIIKCCCTDPMSQEEESGKNGGLGPLESVLCKTALAFFCRFFSLQWVAPCMTWFDLSCLKFPRVIVR